MVGNLSRSKVKITRGRAATSVGIPKDACTLRRVWGGAPDLNAFGEWGANAIKFLCGQYSQALVYQLLEGW